MATKPKNICIGITGASGAVYSLRLIEVLLATGYDVHLSISPSGAQVIHEEMDLRVDLNDFQPADLMLEDVTNASDSKIRMLQASAGIGTADSNVLSVDAGRVGQLHYHHYQNYNSPIASGSFLTQGMVITPCSGATLSAVAHAASGNLIQRAAEVHLKERRKLILVPRESVAGLVPRSEHAAGSGRLYGGADLRSTRHRQRPHQPLGRGQVGSHAKAQRKCKF
jgi:4-hydroxy-3-polyprenylbenzoate decarboxylase